MSDLWPAPEIGEFEHVSVGPSLVLLRVSGRLPAGEPSVGRRPALVADHGSGPQRFDALPSPVDPVGVLRAAYSVAPELIAPETRFWLEFGEGTTVALPAPVPGAGRRPELPTLAEAQERAGRLEDENERLSASLEELEIWRGELERRLADTTTELAQTRAQLAAAQATAAREALIARAEADALEQAAWELMQAPRGARTDI